MSMHIFHRNLRAPGYHGNQGKYWHEIRQETFQNMDLDLLTYAYHYDKEKNRSLNHNYFEVMAEVSYRNPRMCGGTLAQIL